MATELSSSCTGACSSSTKLQIFETITFSIPVLVAFMTLLMICLFYFRKHDTHVGHHSQLRAQLFSDSLPRGLGLSKSFIQELPIASFNGTCMSASQCAVCLGDYELDEKLKQLPHCNHSFHVHCIDEWLAKNATCPLCRTSLCEVVVDGLSDSLDEICNIEMLMREGYRTWENRVVSREAGDQNQNLYTLDASDEELGYDSERDGKSVSEHTVNIEIN